MKYPNVHALLVSYIRAGYDDQSVYDLGMATSDNAAASTTIERLFINDLGDVAALEAWVATPAGMEEMLTYMGAFFDRHFDGSDDPDTIQIIEATESAHADGLPLAYLQNAVAYICGYMS